MMASRRQCTSRPTITPIKTCTASLYRHIKGRVEHSLRGTHCKRNLVSSRKKQDAYKLPGTKSSLFGPKRVPRPLHRQNSSCSYRQHHSSDLHKQRSRHEFGPTVLPSMKDPGLVFQKTGYPQSRTHSRPPDMVADNISRLAQTIQTEWSLLPEVFQSICSRWHQPQIDLFARRFNNKLPLFVSPVPDPPPPWPGQWTHSACLPTGSHLGQSGGEAAGLPMQENHPNFTRVAQHAFVLGPSGHVNPDSCV